MPWRSKMKKKKIKKKDSEQYRLVYMSFQYLRDKIWMTTFYNLALFELMNCECVFPMCIEYFIM